MIQCDIEQCENEAATTISEVIGYSRIVQSMNVCTKHSNLIFNAESDSE